MYIWQTEEIRTMFIAHTNARKTISAKAAHHKNKNKPLCGTAGSHADDPPSGPRRSHRRDDGERKKEPEEEQRKGAGTVEGTEKKGSGRSHKANSSTKSNLKGKRGMDLHQQVTSSLTAAVSEAVEIKPSG